MHPKIRFLSVSHFLCSAFKFIKSISQETRVLKSKMQLVTSFKVSYFFSSSQCERSGQTLLCHCLVDVLKYSEETEAAQSGRMYFFYFLEGFCQFQPPLVLIISHIQYWKPSYLLLLSPLSSHFSAWNMHSYGNGFLYNPVNCRNSTLSSSCVF